jgi:hypothetical protein
MKKLIMTFIVFSTVSAWFVTQGQVAINNDGSPPDPSAILDLQSSNQGLLVPRIDFNDRPDPAAPGLLIYVMANGPQGDNALYLYDGTNWLMLATAFTGIGSFREGGVVFWLDETGNHGLVSTTEDLGYYEWGCFGTLIGPDAQNTGIGTGDLNTAAIISECTDESIAAYNCDILDLNGYSDWFLPSRDELAEMYVQRAAIGGFQNNLYWSSTEAEFAEVPEEAAWIVYFLNGSQGWTSKAGALNVRCVRKF